MCIKVNDNLLILAGNTFIFVGLQRGRLLTSVLRVNKLLGYVPSLVKAFRFEVSYTETLLYKLIWLADLFSNWAGTENQSPGRVNYLFFLPQLPAITLLFPL